MAKALALTPETLGAPQITPRAATPARSASASAKAAAPKAAAETKADQVPLQIRIPRKDSRAIKIAAAQNDQTISDFMLSCFHAHMKHGKHD